MFYLLKIFTIFFGDALLRIRIHGLAMIHRVVDLVDIICVLWNYVNLGGHNIVG